MHYLAKINMSSESVEIESAAGLSGVTAEIVDGNICRLRHPQFTRALTFAFPALIEQRDVETSVMAACGDGICDVYCYDAAGRRVGFYYFQIRIDVEA